jgi:hypothetical protein
MAVDTTHKDYAAGQAKWSRCRDAVDGQDAVHAAGEKYLPRLKDQTDPEYKAYKQRATYFNATGRTLEGLVGMVMRKDAEIEAPDTLRDMLDDVDLNGTTINGLAAHLVNDVLEAGRIGLLVEYPLITDQPQSAAQAAERNLRPYITRYCADSILNWKVSRINNVMQPTLVVLQEAASIPEDEFTDKAVDQIRVLMLENGIYIQRVYQRSDSTKEYALVLEITPLIRSQPFGFIPFFMFGPRTNDFTVQDPPILDLADLNLAHYRVTADYEHGCHFTGLPMLMLAGIEVKENEPIHLGSQTAVVTTNAEAHGEFIEFQGQGLGALEKNLDRKEKQMATIGARMLEQQKAGVESEGAMEMRSNGESSVLAQIANLVSQQLTKTLQFFALWAGYTETVTIKLNTDYLPAGLSAQQLSELVKSWQAGAISFETLFENLKRGEVIASTKTVEQEKQEIEDGATVNGAE